MTVKEIAEAVGKDERSVQRWTKKAGDKMSSISGKMTLSSPMNPADYDREETCAIIEAGMGKNAADIYRTNVEGGFVSGTLEQTDDRLDRAFKAAVVQLTNMVNTLDKRMEAVESEHANRKAIAPPPGKNPRAELSEAVRNLAHNNYDGDYRGAWRNVYREIYYRCSINVKVRAKNDGVKPIDVLEREGLIETATQIAVEMQSL